MTASSPTKKTRTLIDALLAVKMLISLWNCLRFPAQGGYDNYMHSGRAVHAGLRATRMDYDPPFYYFVNLPTILLDPAAKKDVDGLMTVIEWSNLLYLFVFYVVWIYFIFPRVLPGARSWTVASVILLALPGYQKLAAMVHSDNILTTFTACTFACWLWLDQRRARFEGVGGQGKPYKLRALFGFAAIIGLTGLTRPFACLPVALFSVLTLREVWAISRPQIGRFVARAAPLMILVGLLSTTWYVYRWRRAHVVLDAYNHSYIDDYQKYKPGFDFKAYFTTFYFKDLLHTPNRKLYLEDPDAEPGKNRYANSFFTLAYSEMWGDQWLYFSGRGEEKLWEKRVILVGGMPLTLFLLAAWPLGLFRTVREVVRRRRWVTRRTIVLVMTLGAALLYLVWQTHPGLTPGKNSSVKFIYIAYAVPFVLTMCMSFRMRRREYRLMLPLSLLTFALAAPISFYWDTPKRPGHRHKRDPVETPVETRLALPPPGRAAG
jgi:hypothetical protein